MNLINSNFRLLIPVIGMAMPNLALAGAKSKQIAEKERPNIIFIFFPPIVNHFSAIIILPVISICWLLHHAVHVYMKFNVAEGGKSITTTWPGFTSLFLIFIRIW